MKNETTISKDGEEVLLDKWIEENGTKTMYTREKEINFCTKHQFNSKHECNKCPFVFVGFRSHIHVQNEDGIFERKPSHTLGKRLA